MGMITHKPEIQTQRVITLAQLATRAAEGVVNGVRNNITLSTCVYADSLVCTLSQLLTVRRDYQLAQASPSAEDIMRRNLREMCRALIEMNLILRERYSVVSRYLLCVFSDPPVVPESRNAARSPVAGKVMVLNATVRLYNLWATGISGDGDE